MQFPLIVSTGPANCSDPFLIISLPCIGANSLAIMVSIFSLNMYSSEHMWTFAQLSTITDDPSESNPTCSEDYTLEESMCHILSFKIMQKIKGLFLMWPLRGFYIALQLSLLEFVFSLLVLIFFLQIQLLAPLVNWSWIWVA